MKARSLQVVFLGAIAASLGACGKLSSDGGASGGPTVDTGGPLTSPFTCTTAEVAYEALRVATQCDYLELRNVDERTYQDTSVFTIGATVGSKCGAAASRPTCTSALDALTSSDYLFKPCGGCSRGGSYIAYTKRDDVGKVATDAELRSFVGTVDAPAKAWLVLTHAGYAPQCSEPWIRETSDGFVVSASRAVSDCPVQAEDVALRVGRDGAITVLDRHLNAETGVCIGRRPAGLVAPRDSSCGASKVGEHFARIARLEAASVDAFRILRGELQAHGAPRRLLAAADRAARDEARHARMMARIARRHGGVVAPARVVRGPVRSLVDIAIENAVEGCVRETYGALEGMWQARAAYDPAIRAAMKSIARDETRHATLSWTIAVWLDTRLTAAERERVREARAREVQAITDRLRRAPAEELVRVAGVPTASRASAFAAHLRETLWAA